MRTVMIASAGLMLAAVAGGAAAQQRAGATYPVPGRVPAARPAVRAVPAPTVGPATRAAVTPIARPVPAGPRQARWGSKIGGRWWGGANAPGGWNAYRRPARGWALPAYWVAPRFAIGDWSGYGLPTPPTGYRWTRYYDDAVLIDDRGAVYDSSAGLDWDRDDRGDPEPTVYAAPSFDAQGYDGRADARVYADRAADRGAVGRDTPRGPRIGGGGAGQAVAAPAAARQYAPPPTPQGYAVAPVRPVAVVPVVVAQPPRSVAPVRAPGGTWVSSDGLTTITTTGGSSVTASESYPGGRYPGGTTTRVTVQPAPMTTTTTTTTTTEYITYPARRPAARRRRAATR